MGNAPIVAAERVRPFENSSRAHSTRHRRQKRELSNAVIDGNMPRKRDDKKKEWVVAPEGEPAAKRTPAGKKRSPVIAIAPISEDQRSTATSSPPPSPPPISSRSSSDGFGVKGHPIKSAEDFAKSLQSPNRPAWKIPNGQKEKREIVQREVQLRDGNLLSRSPPGDEEEIATAGARAAASSTFSESEPHGFGDEATWNGEDSFGTDGAFRRRRSSSNASESSVRPIALRRGHREDEKSKRLSRKYLFRAFAAILGKRDKKLSLRQCFLEWRIAVLDRVLRRTLNGLKSTRQKLQSEQKRVQEHSQVSTPSSRDSHSLLVEKTTEVDDIFGREILTRQKNFQKLIDRCSLFFLKMTHARMRRAAFNSWVVWTLHKKLEAEEDGEEEDEEGKKSSSNRDEKLREAQDTIEGLLSKLDKSQSRREDLKSLAAGAVWWCSRNAVIKHCRMLKMRSFTSWRIITLKRASRRARQRSNAEELSEKTVRSSSESRLGYSTVLDTLLERVKGATFGKSSQQEELYATLHDFENELQEKNELLEECMDELNTRDTHIAQLKEELEVAHNRALQLEEIVEAGLKEGVLGLSDASVSHFSSSGHREISRNTIAGSDHLRRSNVADARGSKREERSVRDMMAAQGHISPGQGLTMRQLEEPRSMGIPFTSNHERSLENVIRSFPSDDTSSLSSVSSLDSEQGTASFKLSLLPKQGQTTLKSSWPSPLSSGDDEDRHRARRVREGMSPQRSLPAENGKHSSFVEAHGHNDPRAVSSYARRAQSVMGLSPSADSVELRTRTLLQQREPLLRAQRSSVHPGPNGREAYGFQGPAETFSVYGPMTGPERAMLEASFAEDVERSSVSSGLGRSSLGSPKSGPGPMASGHPRTITAQSPVLEDGEERVRRKERALMKFRELSEKRRSLQMRGKPPTGVAWR